MEPDRQRRPTTAPMPSTSIQGGWMATVDAQVLGYNATDYIMSTTAEQVAIAALTAKQAVTIGTQNWTATTNLGLYANHAYAITAYNAKTDTFTLYNPWGSNQPGQLTWAQLQATCTQLCTCNITGTVPLLSTPRVGSAVGSAQAGTTAGMSRSLQYAATASQQAAGGQSGQAADSGNAFGTRHALLVDLARTAHLECGDLSPLWFCREAALLLLSQRAEVLPLATRSSIAIESGDRSPQSKKSHRGGRLPRWRSRASLLPAGNVQYVADLQVHCWFAVSPHPTRLGSP